MLYGLKGELELLSDFFYFVMEDVDYLFLQCLLYFISNLIELVGDVEFGVVVEYVAHGEGDVLFLVDPFVVFVLFQALLT